MGQGLGGSAAEWNGKERRVWGLRWCRRAPSPPLLSLSRSLALSLSRNTPAPPGSQVEEWAAGGTIGAVAVCFGR